MAETATVEQASDAFYAALLATQQALELTAARATTDFRSSFVAAFQTLAVYVAEADGRLSPAQTQAIQRIFHLDGSDPDEISRTNAADVSRIEAAIQTLCAMRIATMQASQQNGAFPPDTASIAAAAKQVFACVLAADKASDPDAERSEAVIYRLADPDLLTAPVITSLSTDAVAGGDAADSQAAAGAPSTPADQAPILASMSCPAQLHAGETCVAVTDAVLYQERNVVRRVRYAGFSARVRIVRGLSYRSGTYDVDRQHEAKVERIAAGTLCVTNQRLIFLSDAKNLDLTIAKLLSFDTGPAMIEVSRSNSGRLLFRDLDSQAVELFEQLTGILPDHRLRLAAAQATADIRYQQDWPYRIAKKVAMRTVSMLLIVGLLAFTLLLKLIA